ncbi:hypothetical protein KEM56_003233 [Ascosphaera pollenicola]|nr:hypothetical protein KEM56_003233 [Ascosphaera pollenicola]
MAGLTTHARYSPPWANTSIIGIAGCSGSGKTSVAMKIIKSLNIPWVAMLVMDSYYKPLTEEQTAAAYRAEFDFDHPDALDMDLLTQTLAELKQGKKVDIPIYSFATHSRQKETLSLYSPHVLIVEGILAFHDPRVAAMMDVKVDMVVRHIQQILRDKSQAHEQELRMLGKLVADEPLSQSVILMEQTPQVKGMNTLLQDPATQQVNFDFYFNRLAGVLITRALDLVTYASQKITTPTGTSYSGLAFPSSISAVSILRGGACLEKAFQNLIPDAMVGRILIQTNYRTAEPELHYHKLPRYIKSHDAVVLLDAQMSSGGAGLMAVRVLVDHGVEEHKIILVAVRAGKKGLNRLTAVYPHVKIVVGGVDEEGEDRWIEKRYFGC